MKTTTRNYRIEIVNGSERIIYARAPKLVEPKRMTAAEVAAEEARVEAMFAALA